MSLAPLFIFIRSGGSNLRYAANRRSLAEPNTVIVVAIGVRVAGVVTVRDTQVAGIVVPIAAADTPDTSTALHLCQSHAATDASIPAYNYFFLTPCQKERTPGLPLSLKAAPRILKREDPG